MRFHIEVQHPERCVGCYSCVLACSRELFNSVGAKRTAVFVRSGHTLDNRFDVVVCRFCKDPECATACKLDALIAAPEGGVSLIASKCEGCKTFDCISGCQFRALALDQRKRIPIICDRCGNCGKFCPHDVFKYEEMKE
mgnify:CR=1 FL=1